MMTRMMTGMMISTCPILNLAYIVSGESIAQDLQRHPFARGVVRFSYYGHFSFERKQEVTKATLTTSPSFSGTESLPVKPKHVPKPIAIVERDVNETFKAFATRDREAVERSRITKANTDKKVKFNDLKKFADSFKLHTPIPSDLVSIIAKDPTKQKEIQEKAKRNAEESTIPAAGASKTAERLDELW